MRLKSITIRHFKRFTNLSVVGIPAETRFIVLAGPNGSGKSSFFDALHVWHEQHNNRGVNWQDDYHRKVAPQAPPRFQGDEISIDLHHPLPDTLDALKKMFYIRSAYRNEADFKVNNIGRMGDPLDVYPVVRLIDDDRSVSRNYQRLVSEGIVDLYGRAPGCTTFQAYRDLAVNRIGKHLKKILPDLELNTLGNPFDDGTFRFTKGTSNRYSYKNLSGGEKATFDLLSDLIVAVRNYNDTVFCIDEPELHLSTRLQSLLMRMLYDLLPEQCQLILATHSIGMMRSARDLWKERPQEVAFLDFGNRDFDAEVTIAPERPNRAFWEAQYAVALDDLATLVAPERLVICEGAIGDPQMSIHANHDARCYSTIFSEEFPDTTFISGGGGTEIESDHYGLATAFGLLHSDMNIIRLIDRDDRTDERVDTLRNSGVRVLSRRHLESYLFDDEILKALAVAEKQPEKADLLVQIKCRELPAGFDIEEDDIKKKTGNIFKAIRKELGITRQGEDAKEFARSALAPLVTPETKIYSMLKHDIFD